MLKRSVLFSSCGLAAGAATAVPLLWPLAFFAPVPLLFWIGRRETAWRSAAFSGFLFGTCMSGVAVFWLWHALPLDWLVADRVAGWYITLFSWALTAASMGLGTALFSALAQRMTHGALSDLAIIPALWIIGEEARMWAYALLTTAPNSLLEPHFSFGAIGYALAQSPLLLQIADPGGVRSLSFVVILGATALTFLLRAIAVPRMRMHAALCACGAAALITLALAGASYRAQHASLAAASSDRVPVALISTYLPMRHPTESLVPRYEALLSDAAARAETPRIVILPEGYGLQAMYGNPDAARAALSNIFATSTFVISTSLSSSSGTTTFDIDYLDSARGIVATSEKRFFAPQGETVPYVARFLALPFLDASLRRHIDEDARNEAGLLQESGSFQGTKVGALFCSEIASPTLYANLARATSPDILANLASQSWFHGSHLLYDETLAMAKVHAVQNRLSFLTAMDGAPSYAVDASGALIAEAPWGEEGVTVADVPVQ